MDGKNPSSTLNSFSSTFLGWVNLAIGLGSTKCCGLLDVFHVIPFLINIQTNSPSCDFPGSSKSRRCFLFPASILLYNTSMSST